MKFKRIYGLLVAASFATSAAWADSLALKNGNVLNGKFLSGTVDEITFQVGSTVQTYDLAEINFISFDSQAQASDMPTRPPSARLTEASTASSIVRVPAGTRICIRTIDGIDSTKNHVGDPFQASLEEPLTADGKVVVPKGADVLGRLAQSQPHGTFTGRSELRLELTGIVVNGETLPLVTGEYDLTGKSRGASTAKRTVGVGATGAIIGAIAGGGKGAAIGAASGAAVGAGSEIFTKGDQVKVPSETLLEFTLERDLSIPRSSK
jgi:hypothetical protein